jgi:hypothetical protein
MMRRQKKSAPLDQHPPTVGASWEGDDPSLSSHGIKEDSADDAQGSTGARSRAPPTS